MATENYFNVTPAQFSVLVPFSMKLPENKIEMSILMLNVSVYGLEKLREGAFYF